jgi:hypothetical protein
LILELLTVAVGLVVFGAHVVIPWRLAAGAPGLEKVWARTALPALGLAIAVALLAVRIAPDAAIAWGMTGGGVGALAVRLLGIGLVALVAVDLLAAFAAARLGRPEWLVAAGFGVSALALQTLSAEMLRIGWGPVPGHGALVASALLRVPLAVAAGELVVGRPRLATTVAGPALAAAVALWPRTLLAALGPDLLTLAAAVPLLLAARFLPGRLARIAGTAGLVLATIFLARSASTSATIGTTEQLPYELLAP